MATLKSILHHFNKALKEYDTLHPETEVAQIVDLLPTINAAINGSSVTWDGKKFTNNELGITGLIDTNGYVAFGPNFGGLIIQWGTASWAAAKAAQAVFPISFTNTNYVICATGHIEDNATAYLNGILYNHKAVDSCLLRCSETGGPAAEYVAIGM